MFFVLFSENKYDDDDDDREVQRTLQKIWNDLPQKLVTGLFCHNTTTTNNNNNDNVYGAVIVVQSHCESSSGSYDQCGMAPSGRRPSDQAK